MKILYICYEDIAGFNGATRHINEVVKGFSNRNNKVNLCVPFIWRKKPKLDFGSNTKLRYIITVPIKGLKPISYVIASFIYMPFIYVKFRPDIVYIREIKFTIFPVLLAKLLDIPCVVEVNGLIDEVEKVKSASMLLLKVLKSFHRWNLNSANHIITVTSGIKKEMVSLYGLKEDKITIITNGVDISKFKPIKKTEAILQTCLKKGYKYVGFVGGLFPWHGLDQLINAAIYAIENGEKIRFVIVGSGRLEYRLKQMVHNYKLEEKIIFTGSVPFDKVPYYINSFDICIVFFKKVRKDPGDPIKLYEYMACGRPIIASNVRGYGDVVEFYKSGVSVNSEDPKVTGRKIKQLLEDKSKAKKMGANGFKNAIKFFNWKDKIATIEELLGNIKN